MRPFVATTVPDDCMSDVVICLGDVEWLNDLVVRIAVADLSDDVVRVEESIDVIVTVVDVGSLVPTDNKK